MLDKWHAAPERFDNALDAWIHRIYADILAEKPLYPPKGIPYFSPSSANSCRRELYEKLRGAKRDQQTKFPHQGRWTRLGTQIGGLIQRDILFIEKHYASAIGESPRFQFERTSEGLPMFEEFAKKAHIVEHNGKRFALYGTCDGIMLYRTDDGEVLRVGLEIKSKQTTHSQTSEYSMREPNADHVKQCVTYSIMYGVDHYVILYVNASKKAWNMDADDYMKNPDVRAFHIFVTERDRQALLDEFTDVLQSVEVGNPPALDAEKFTFNNYKTACAISLSDAEIETLRNQAKQAIKSRMPDWKKQAYVNAVSDIERIRGEAVS